jgi:L-rhamnose isomerase
MNVFMEILIMILLHVNVSKTVHAKFANVIVANENAKSVANKHVANKNVRTEICTNAFVAKLNSVNAYFTNDEFVKVLQIYQLQLKQLQLKQLQLKQLQLKQLQLQQLPQLRLQLKIKTLSFSKWNKRNNR